MKTDKQCPQDRCPNSGGFPACIDGTKLLETHLASCKAKHAFEIWKYGKREDGPPRIKPDFKPKARMVTPNNRLVGAVVVSQRRMALEACNPMESATVNTRSNKFVHKYSGEELNKCLSGIAHRRSPKHARATCHTH